MPKALVAGLSSVLIAGYCFTVAASAASVPCEKPLADVKAAIASAKLTNADKAKVQDLQTKGTERCKADDDARADEFFTQALKIMGK